jgi:hypothetical protein
MITFTRAVGTAELTRDEVITLHQDNVTAIRRRIKLIRAAGPEPGADTLRVITSLEADVDDQLELIELAKCSGYPYPLAGTDD